MFEPRTDWGHFRLTLDEYMRAHGISRNKLVKAADLQYTQLQSYCNNTIQRPDLGVLARICFALQCDLSDIVQYEPPEE